jgi:hypothetical protein
MRKVWYYVPSTQINWECEAEDEAHALEVIKELEGVKRIPQTWKIWIEYNGEMIEINRKYAVRLKAEKKKGEKILI